MTNVLFQTPPWESDEDFQSTKRESSERRPDPHSCKSINKDEIRET